MSVFDSDWWSQFYQRHRLKLFVAQALGFVVLGLALSYALTRTPGKQTPGNVHLTGAHHHAAEEETLWTCSMHPQIRQPKPGKCPLCGMNLIPVAKASGGLRTIALSPESKALMRIETTPVERRYVTHQIPMIGRVDYDETRLGYITAWVPGRLDRLYVDYTGVKVKKGDHLVYIYSEQLYSAQEELIQAIKSRRERGPGTSQLVQPIDLVESAREKLRLLGLKEEQIAEIEKRGKPSDHITIYASLGGIVIQKLKQQGERVQLGERIYTIADLNEVWVHLDAYESDLPWLRYGQDVTITTEAYPGDEFHGLIAFIQPVLDDKTRTVKVRVNVPNPTGKLKPEMFVHAIVRPTVAAGGRVMDPNLVGKWLSPMHPEIVKDEPGTCDICGMPLVRAESLGYVTADAQAPPLVVPYLAALVTGTRAIVYVQLPDMPAFVEPALQTLSTVVQDGKLKQTREAFAKFGEMLDQPYGANGTVYARRLWNKYADQLSSPALAGQRAATNQDAIAALAEIETTVSHLREQFAPPNHPTYEGREIVLGPRAGDYFLVRNGLEEGELVVTQGNFKIDSEIQIQAKPSMMTPEGGGGGGHHHGGMAKKPGGEDHAQHTMTMTLPGAFRKQLADLEKAYEALAKAVDQKDTRGATAAFRQFATALAAVDGEPLTGHPRMMWKEFAMLLSNDAVEGRDAESQAQVDRVFLLLKGHMRRMREQFNTPEPVQQPNLERMAVAPQFQTDLARVWERYVAVGDALAADDPQKVREYLASLETAVATVDDKPLEGRAQETWTHERTNLEKLIAELKKATDLQAQRAQFLPLSQEIGVLARVFGFGEPGPIYELHCPMAFQGKGGVWYQTSKEVRNPYFGSTMLKCADRVHRVVHDEPPAHEHAPPKAQQDHDNHPKQGAQPNQ